MVGFGARQAAQSRKPSLPAGAAMAQGQEIKANRQEGLEAARSAYSAGDLSRAEELIKAALSEGAADWELLGLSGAVAIARGQAAAAIPMLTRALELVPPLSVAGRVLLLNDLGNGYQRLGERETGWRATTAPRWSSTHSLPRSGITSPIC